MSPAAFTTAYKTYYDRLYTLAFRMSGNKEKAEDILQTSYLNAFKAWDSFKEESSVYTWLYRIVVNCSKKEWLKEQKLPLDRYAEEHHMGLEEVYSYINRNGEFEDDVITERVRETCLQMFMNCLPPDYRIIYTLRNILQLSVKESAEILDKSESAIKVGLNRAKKMLQDHFNGRCSLVKKGALCNCRAFAQHVVDERKEGSMYDIQVIRTKEKGAAQDFYDSLKELVEVDELYDTRIVPLDFEVLQERVKEHLGSGNNALLKN